MPPDVKCQILNDQQAHIAKEFTGILAKTVESLLATVENSDSHFTTLDPPIHVDLNEGYYNTSDWLSTPIHFSYITIYHVLFKMLSLRGSVEICALTGLSHRR